MTEITVICFAVFGGLAMNIFRLTEMANTPRAERPPTFRDPLFCVQFFLLPLIGGGLAYAYQASGITFNPILAINIGVSAPLILKTFANTVPPIGNNRID